MTTMIVGMVAWLAVLAIAIIGRIAYYRLKALYYDLNGQVYLAAYNRLRARGYK